MRKSTFIWRELYNFSPVSVQRCACIWMFTGARTQIRAVAIEAMMQELNKSDEFKKDPVALDNTANQIADEILSELDDTHQHSRRIVFTSLLASGLVLTLQPWLALNFFSLPLLAAGAMLLGLEFSPRTGSGLAGLAKRFKDDFTYKKS